MTTAFDFDFEKLGGGALPLAQFAGRPMLIVNTASKCGFTPQYRTLQAVWQTRRARDLIVLGVPCNDFGAQEPGEAATIQAFCACTYGVDFPMTAKVHVRGPHTHPLFTWLAETGGFWSRPRWNFYKYLIGGDGTLRQWFSSITSPASTRFDRALDRLD